MDDSHWLSGIAPAQSASKKELTDVLLHSSSNDSSLSIRIAADPSPGCGGIAWPAGQVLANYLFNNPAIVANRSVLDLGSGTGLVGLVAAYLNARHVYLSDQAPLLDVMRTNVKLNDQSSRVSVIEYNWGEPKPDSMPEHIDVVLAADCVYFEPAFPLLVSTLCDLIPLPSLSQSSSELTDTSNGQPEESQEVLFCYKKRRKADKRFFALLKKHFDWKQVEDPDYETYNREAISLLRLVRRK
ncbi:S-adenosyl-L-methionine-dependent methyltransferase [Pyrrhoderma noxium]|uniref:Protein-lysine N-methyltransferase EFM6 n=1 Tax=Pyrrhoderma noxium TaxID=2282107 RepID=A0A286UNC8_9AGAM|nr:S-adenosyl-L-methionine-dependent methyltransferase [Pyrrhoderma noxium]